MLLSSEWSMHWRDVIVVFRDQVKDARPKRPEESVISSGSKRGLRLILVHQILSSGHPGFFASVWTDTFLSILP